MFKIETTEKIHITPQMASGILKYNTLPSQRNLRRKHVEELFGKMKSGEFLVGDIGIALMPDGTSILINGQHQLHAILKFNKGVDCNIIRLRCANDNDLSLAFRQFDTNLSKSLSQMINVEAHTLKINWKKSIPGLVVSAHVLNKHGYSGSNISKLKRAELLKTVIPQGNFVNELMSKNVKLTRHIKTVDVTAVIILTFNSSETKANKFWCNVRDGQLLDSTMPEYHLRNFLLTSSIATRGNTEKIKTTHKEVRCKCINAWNVFKAGGSMTRLSYSPKLDVPKVK